MCSIYSLAPGRQLFVLAVALVLFSNGWQSASGQIPNTTQVPRLERAPDPPANTKRLTGKRSANRARQSSNLPKSSANTPLNEKQQAVEDAIEQGNKSRGVNDYERALDHYRTAQTLNPQEARAFYGMGNLYSDLYCHDSAIEAYLNALNLNKEYLEAYVGLGYAYAGKERYDDAEKNFREALNRRRENVDANLGLGRIFLVKGKYQEAIAQFNLVLNSATLEAKDRAAAHVALGDAFWKQEKQQDAVAQFEEALRLKPDLAGAYLELGNAQAAIAYSKLGTFVNVNEINMRDLEAFRASEKQAVANLEDARKYGYNHPNLHEYIALALAKQFRYEDAVAQLKEYFAEVDKLESRITSSGPKCSAGFDRLKAEGYLYLGLVYYFEGTFEADARRKAELLGKALEQFKQALKLKQDFALAYQMAGNIYNLQKKLEEAISQHQKALLYSTEEPLRISLYQSIGIQYARLGRYTEALENVQEALKRDPKNPAVYESFADIYVAQGKLEDCLAALKKASDLRAELKTEADANPNSYYYLGTTYTIRFMQGRNEEDFNQAVKALNEAIKIKPRYSLAYQARGLAYETHANADEALANYQKAHDYDPTNPQYFSNMADVYFYLKDNDDAAIGFLKQAIGLQPDYAMGYWKLGMVYRHKKDFDEAIKQLLQAIKYDPKFLQSYFELAYIYRLQKNYPEAIKYLTTATEIEPTNSKLYQQMGLIYQERSSADEALTNFKRAIEYDPKNPVNYAYVAIVYFELKHDDDTAIKQLLKAIEVAPKYLDAYLSLGAIYKTRKDYAEAINYLNKAKELAPTDFHAFKELAKVYEDQQKNADAIHFYEEAISRLGADEASVKNLYLGRIARLKGQYAEAIEYFRKLNFPEGPAQNYFDIGVTYVVSKNRRAALEQYQQLVQLKSPMAEELLKKINELK